MVAKTLVAGAGVEIVENGATVTISGALVTTTWAFNPFNSSDETGTEGTYLTLSGAPTGFLTDGADWSIAVRLSDCCFNEDQYASLFCSDITSGGVSCWSGLDSGGDSNWGRMKPPVDMAQDVPTPWRPDGWLIFAFDSSAGTFDAWINGTKTNTGTSATFASSQPTLITFGQEAAGQTAAPFFGLCGSNISAIVIANAYVFDDTDAAEFVSSEYQLSELSAGLQSDISNYWTFTSMGPGTDKGAINLTANGVEDTDYSYREVLIPEAP